MPPASDASNLRRERFSTAVVGLLAFAGGLAAHAAAYPWIRDTGPVMLVGLDPRTESFPDLAPPADRAFSAPERGIQEVEGRGSAPAAASPKGPVSMPPAQSRLQLRELSMFEERGAPEAFRSALDLIPVRPLGLNRREYESGVASRPDGGRLASYAALLEYANRHRDSPTQDGSPDVLGRLKYRLLAYAVHGELNVLTGEWEGVGTWKRSRDVAKALLAGVGRRVSLESLPPRLRGQILDIAESALVRLLELRKSVWRAVQEVVDQRRTTGRVETEVLACVGRMDGSLLLVRKGDDGDLERDLLELEALERGVRALLGRAP